MAVIEKGAFRVKSALRKWMELKGWDQRQLAFELGCNESLVSMWFDDKNPRKPSWQLLRKLCLLTGLDVGELLMFDRNIEQEGE